MSLLKHRIDILTVSVVVLLFLAQLYAYLFVTTLGVLSVLSIVFCLLATQFSGPISHHQQHHNFFYSNGLNRLFEMIMALQIAVIPYGWVFHHNLGHHQHYLNQPPKDQPDESRWKREDGTPMGRFEYTWHNFCYAYVRANSIGKKHPYLYKKYKCYGWIFCLLLILLFLFHPLSFLLIFFIPMIFAFFLIILATYDHHAGLDTNESLAASYNKTSRWYNRLTANLGYHTAHHLNPGLHWSQLPALHKAIAHLIPSKLISPYYFRKIND